MNQASLDSDDERGNTDALVLYKLLELQPIVA